MKKRILSLVAALALASAIVAPVQAANLVDETGYNAQTWAEMPSAEAHAKYDTLNSGAKSKVLKEVTDFVVDRGIDQVDTGKVKVQLVDNGKVNVITGDAKDNLQDNGIKPFTREAVKARMEGKTGAGKGKISDQEIVGIYEAQVTANSTGDVAFKVDLDQNAEALSGDAYAVVFHYTGNASDEDGITYQICKVTTGGKVTAHINSFSPIGIITTKSENAQKIANTYSKSIGSDGGDAATTTTTTGTTLPTEVTTQQPTGQEPTGTKGNGAASPKTSDNAYALYLILAVAAVAGTTLVATKKTR
jgi:hypothetical protein